MKQTIKYLKKQLKEIRKQKRALQRWDYADKMKGQAIIDFLEKCIYMEEAECQDEK